jgi:hypothetical protein
MAMGRAAYAWDFGGGDGWVTPESYPAIEADGFSGAGTDAVIDAERLRSDFAAYRPELATFGFDLVRMHHSATKHAEQLVKALRGAGPPSAVAAELETLARLVRLEYRAAIRVDRLEADNRGMAEGLDAMRDRAVTAEKIAVAERSLRLAAEERLGTVLGSRSWRWLAPLRRLGSRLRHLRG